MVDREPVRMRRVVLEERFFPNVGVREEGVVIPASPQAVSLRDEWNNNWLQNYSRSRDSQGHVLQEPTVSLGPSTLNGKQGYSVRKEIIYPYE